MAHVVILTLVFPPDGVSTAQIMGDLATDLMGRGHAVSVITTTPHYNRDPEAETRQPLARWWGRVVQRSCLAGAEVYHTIMPRKSGSVIARLAAWIQFHLLSLIVGFAALRRVDVIITPSPPLTMGVAAWLLGWWHRAPFIYNVQELYPDIAINLGAVRNRMVIRLLFALERFVYARSTAVTVIADRMRRRVVAKGVPQARVEVIPNFADHDALRPVPAPNAFTHEHDLDGRFIVSYAGNVGPAQGLDSLLDAARLLADEPAVVFLLIGGGTLWTALAARVQSESLRNVKLIDFQPFSRMSEIYGASDLSVVAQAASTGSDAVPSKAYRIMACGRPILAITERTSDLAGLVDRSACGFVVPQSDPAAIAGAVRRAHGDVGALRVMGARGREHVAAHYSREHVTAQYDALVRRAVRASGRSPSW